MVGILEIKNAAQQHVSLIATEFPKRRFKRINYLSTPAESESHFYPQNSCTNKLTTNEKNEKRI